jgi:hypothetical protein
LRNRGIELLLVAQLARRQMYRADKGKVLPGGMT